ncbi:hypothetical protein mRhiFer1_008514 [Rhinolophus ferrumequinum]|uniref:Uncharacterized protein n=1 Tax=Rhinolophus ferrumequinum TaxID=59479 RepID=A0A7J7UXF8_RHIFE|nr:hypothetical protein mRhiFer1_008514 [Rhinolophus ferrumequinum]
MSGSIQSRPTIGECPGLPSPPTTTSTTSTEHDPVSVFALTCCSGQLRLGFFSRKENPACVYAYRPGTGRDSIMHPTPQPVSLSLLRTSLCLCPLVEDSRWAPKEHTRGGKGPGFQYAPHGNLLAGGTSQTS